MLANFKADLIKHLSIKDDFAPLLRLALPLILNGIVQSLLYFLVNIFLARLGTQIFAAGALVGWLFATLVVIIFGIFSSVNVLVAHKHGANDVTAIAYVLRDGLLLAVILTVPTFLLFWNMSPVFLLFGQSEDLVKLATSYLHPLAFGLLPKFIMIVLYEFLLGLGHARVITVLTVLTTPIYIALSWLLIFGKFGLPALGIAGAGWGMTLGDWLATLCVCGYVFSNKQYRCYLRALFTFIKPSYVWEILHLGVPMGVMYFFEVGFFFAMALLMGLLGMHALAANQLTMQYLGPLMGSIFSIAQAITVRMGHQLGAKQFAIAERASYTGIIVVAIYMSIIALIYWFFPLVLISIDFNVHATENFETVKFTKEFLFIAAFFQFFEAIRIALFGALRGLKDTRFTLIASIISFWCIALPIGYALSMHFKWGGSGYWWGMVMGAACSVLLLYRRFKLKMHEYIHASLTLQK